MVDSNSAVGSSALRWPCCRPALLTSPTTGPCSATVANAASSDASSVTSQANPRPAGAGGRLAGARQGGDPGAAPLEVGGDRGADTAARAGHDDPAVTHRGTPVCA